MLTELHREVKDTFRITAAKFRRLCSALQQIEN